MHYQACDAFASSSKQTRFLLLSSVMKNEASLPSVIITEKGAKKLKSGHVWVFADEVISMTEGIVDGSICRVFSGKEKFLGTGFFNSSSLIRIRIISKNANDTFSDKTSEDAFWMRRVKYAVRYRYEILSKEDFSSCRLIFGEADGFPGLTVDKFENVLVCQSMSLGIEQRKLMIYRQLIEELANLGCKVAAVFERNDNALREKEGMTQGKGFLNAELGLPPYNAESTSVIITENGIRYIVDFCNGQKTGFFLDQKFNRREAAAIAREKTVLDCFTHTGSFGLNCLKCGAKSVTFLDVSKFAIEETRANVQLNGVPEDKCEFICEDAFDFLLRAKAERRFFDFVILDPPAFTKSGKTVKNALAGYRELNRLGMSVIKRGGYLATASCSHFATEELFEQAIFEAADELHLQLKQIKKCTAAPDHPILWGVPETAYLKFLLLQLV